MIKIDARRLFCPMPVIKVQDEAAKQAPGAHIEVTCSDPGALHDIPAWARINGHTVLFCKEEKGLYIVAIEVGPET